MPARRRCALAAAVLAIGSAPRLHAAPPPSTQPPDPSGGTVIASVGDQRVTASDIIDRNQEAFARLQRARDNKLQALELDYAHSYHQLMQRQLDDFLDQRALGMEAAARHTTPAALKAGVTIAPVTDQEVRSFYEGRKAQIDQPYEQVATPIREYLTEEGRQAAFRRYYDGLRAKYAIAAELGPYRVPVAASGPARGSASAPVTIIEFGDFECPYCAEAERELRSILSAHPQEVRLVYRNLPLADLHPHAELAARAGVCADQQGKFWDLHDVMFKDPSALGADALKASAARLGLDGKAFARCLDDASATSKVLEADAQAAAELGLGGTPYFFVNGRPLQGVGSRERFETIIAEELRQATVGTARAAR